METKDQLNPTPVDPIRPEDTVTVDLNNANSDSKVEETVTHQLVVDLQTSETEPSHEDAVLAVMVETDEVPVPEVHELPLEEPVSVEQPPITDEIPVEKEPAAETPLVETHVTEPPVVESLTDETSAVEAPAVEEPVSETPVVDTPAVSLLPETVEEKAEAELPAVEQMAVLPDIHEELDEDEEDELQAELAADITDYHSQSREQLIDSLENALQEDDLAKIRSQVALIKVEFLKKSKEERHTQFEKFISEGGNEEDYHPEDDSLEIRFKEVFANYREKKARFDEVQEKQKLENLEIKNRILTDLKNLINSEETLKKTYDQFRELQEEWKSVGMVPKSEINNLWQSYHFLVEKFFDKVKINKELKDLDLRKNLERKIELCEKVEELLLEKSILKSFKQLQKYHEEWKEIGPVPQDKKDEIWERFKAATDKINDRRREHYSAMQEEQDRNYLQKVALCEKAEQIIGADSNSVKKWQDTTTKINELLKVWKTIGPAGRKKNDEIWERFKNSLDNYFAEKKDYFGKLKDQQVNNYNLKLDLCTQAEALKESSDWKNTTREFIQLQEEWKKIGPVPRKLSDKIWKRFRTACDEFFNRKTEYFQNIRKTEADNMALKQILIDKVKTYEFGTDRSENLSVLKGFQREWTDIGFVPLDMKEKLQNEFRETINKQLDKLNINAFEMNPDSYRSRVETMRHSQDANRQMGRERQNLQIKISKLQEDIMLWENNIGFLADTKNANILREEFEKKINRAKMEVTSLEEKLRILVE